MNKKQRRRTLWSFLGPLLGYWGIMVAVEFIADAVIMVPYINSAYDTLVSLMDTMTYEEILAEYVEILTPAMELAVQYQVEISGLAALATILLTGHLYRKDRMDERAPLTADAADIRPAEYGKILVLAAAGSIGATCLMTLAEAAFGTSEYASVFASAYESPLAVQVLVLGLVTPAAEELMFRGVLYRRYREKRSFWYAAVWSSLIFGFMHSTVAQLVYGFFLGLVLCYLYEKFGSIKAPLALHGLLNITSLVCTEMGVFTSLCSTPARIAGSIIFCTFVCAAMVVMIQPISGPVSPHPEGGEDGQGTSGGGGWQGQ